MCMAGLFIIAKISQLGRDKHMWYIPTVEYHSAIKRAELLIHWAPRMNPRCIVFSERGQTQRLHTGWLHLVCNIPDTAKL